MDNTQSGRDIRAFRFIRFFLLSVAGQGFLLTAIGGFLACTTNPTPNTPALLVGLFSLIGLCLTYAAIVE